MPPVWWVWFYGVLHIIYSDGGVGKVIIGSYHNEVMKV